MQGPKSVTRNHGMMKNAWRLRCAGAALIILLTVLAYLPALRGKFVWDDDSWTTSISGLLSNFSGLRSIWCQPTVLAQYYPLTGTTFWMDYHFWGFWTLPYHVENLLLHVLAALLFWGLLRRLQVPGAWLAGAIFALHPVMVESVAWITERKNVLSLVLYLGALLAYLRYAQSVAGGGWRVASGPTSSDPGAAGRGYPSPATRHPSLFYGLAFILFLAALLAKTTAFSLPAVILLIGWWQRGRIRWRADVLPTLPFFAAAIGLCLGTAWLEKNHVGAKGPEWIISFPEHCLIAGRVLWFYTGKLCWPANLCFIYPRWQLNAGSWWQWLYPVTAVGVLFTLWLARARIGRGPLTAALFFGGTLFPVLGFVNVYFMRYSFVCDHWVYLSSLGVIALAAGLITRVAGHFRAPALLTGFAAVVLVILWVLTWRQSAIYTGLETLWRDTLVKNPDCSMAHDELGLALEAAGKVAEAQEHFEHALRIKPDFAEAQDNLGTVLVRTGRVQEGIAHMTQAVRINPDYDLAYYNLGIALVQTGKFEEAVGCYEQVLRINPDSLEAHNRLADVLARLGRVPEAMTHWERVLQINPDYFEAHNNLGFALMRAGRLTEAVAHFKEAVRIKPDYARARESLTQALAQQGRIEEEIGQYEQALRLKPDYPETHLNLGLALAQQGRLEEAIAHWKQALQFKPDYPEAHYDWGVALEQLGRKNDAIGQYTQALRLKPDYAEARDNLGNALLAVGRIPEAVESYNEVVRMQPDSAEAHNNLALALAEQGKIEEAITQLETALRLKPDLEGGQQMLEHLRELQRQRLSRNPAPPS